MTAYIPSQALSKILKSLANLNFKWFVLLLSLLGVFYSWYTSYPVPNYFLPYEDTFHFFNPLLWPSLSIALMDLYLIGYSTKNNYVKIFSSSLMVLLTFSPIFFYPILQIRHSGGDSAYFRGLSEHFLSLETLTIGRKNVYNYYEWPLLFIFIKEIVIITGISVNIVSFLFFATMTIVASLGLFAYLSDEYQINFAIPALFFMMFPLRGKWQFSAFSFAFTLLTIMLPMLNRKLKIPLILLFIALMLSHPVVTVFVIILLLFLLALRISNKYVDIACLFLAIYFSDVMYRTVVFFNSSLPRYFSEIFVSTTYLLESYAPKLTPASQSPLYLTCAYVYGLTQLFLVILMCLGFLRLIKSRKIRYIDLCVLLVGVISLFSYPLLKSLALRGDALILVGLSNGFKGWLNRDKLKKFVSVSILLILALYPATLIRDNFFPYTWSETPSDLRADNFLTRFLSGPSYSAFAQGPNAIYLEVIAGISCNYISAAGKMYHPYFNETNFVLFNKELETHLKVFLHLPEELVLEEIKKLFTNEDIIFSDGHTLIFQKS